MYYRPPPRNYEVIWQSLNNHITINSGVYVAVATLRLLRTIITVYSYAYTLIYSALYILLNITLYIDIGVAQAISMAAGT